MKAEDIREMVKSCRMCRKHVVIRRGEILSTLNVASRLVEVVGMNLFVQWTDNTS